MLLGANSVQNIVFILFGVFHVQIVTSGNPRVLLQKKVMFKVHKWQFGNLAFTKIMIYCMRGINNVSNAAKSYKASINSRV